MRVESQVGQAAEDQTQGIAHAMHVFCHMYIPAPGLSALSRYLLDICQHRLSGWLAGSLQTSAQGVSV